MRRTVILIALLAAVAVPTAGASARQPMTAGAQTLELRGGRGTAVLALRGSVLGKIRYGRVVVTKPSWSNASVYVTGWEVRERLNATTVLYKGWYLGYRLFGGSWRLKLVGRGINLSAAGRGYFKLGGAAGTYSVAGAPYRAWPTALTTFTLGS
jgi:hypothetical protein